MNNNRYKLLKIDHNSSSEDEENDIVNKNNNNSDDDNNYTVALVNKQINRKSLRICGFMPKR